LNGSWRASETLQDLDANPDHEPKRASIGAPTSWSAAVLSSKTKARHRLLSSGQALPELTLVPRRVDLVQGLRLVLLTGQEDPLHQIWNDLIIAATSVQGCPDGGAQLRYLVGSNCRPI